MRAAFRATLFERSTPRALACARTSWIRLKAALLAVGLAILFAQASGVAVAPAPDVLPFSTGYLLTGDYKVSSIDLVNPSGGFASGTIPMSGVPPYADILAAFLYWEAISPLAAPAAAAGVTFRGQPIAKVRVKAAVKPLTGDTSSCFASGSALSITMFRADVLALLPPQKDKNGIATGKLLVNDADLISNGLPLNTVRVPDVADNVAPQGAGASLVIVYRDPAQPLRRIVIHDGVHVQPQGQTTELKIRGIYQSDASNKSARITHIVGSGAKNPTDVLYFNNAKVKSNPFVGSPNSSDRGWGDATVDVSAKMPGTDAGDGFGETVTTKVTHTKSTPYECLSWAAVLFSTTVKDDDHDGLPDKLEMAGGPLHDPPSLALPNGPLLPDLYAMGARTGQQDLFVEVNALRTTGTTRYGSASAPYDSSASPVVPYVDAPAHNHMPTPEVLKLVGDAFRDAPGGGIKAHFDVGNITQYHLLGSDYARTTADSYFVPSALATGGEIVEETACAATDATCQFPDYPGTVGWGFSMRQFMLGPLTPGTVTPPTRPRYLSPRFDENREGLFHYVLYAHSRGRAKSFPCLDAVGTPVNYEDGTGLCAVNPATGTPRNNPGFNPLDYHVPTSSSGVADLPGSKSLVSLGRWDNFVGSAFMRASTLFHELGHNFERWHGGNPPTYTVDPITKQLTKGVEPNCKPNYLSSMSYLFQLRGLLDNAGVPHLAFSTAANPPINEGSLRDGPILPGEGDLLPYRTAWYVPLGSSPPSLADTLGLPAATKLCNGLPLPSGVQMARYDSPSTSPFIDWRTNGFTPGELSPLDVNFDNTVNMSLTGFNDWASIRLDQTGGGRFMSDVSNGGQDFGGQDFGGQDFGGQDFGGQDFGGQDFGGQDFGGQDFGGQDFGGQDFGGRDFDGQDFGGQDFGGQDFGGDGEVTYEIAVAAGASPPNALTACVLGGDLPAPRGAAGTPVCAPADGTSPLHRTKLTWTAPNVGTVALYHVYRVVGSTVLPESVPVEVGTGTTATSLIDTEELPDLVQFTYYVKADFVDLTESGASNFSTITARNDAPIALADARITNEDTPISGVVATVLPNDTDVDSALLRPVLVAGPSNGTLDGPLGLNPDGSFTYRPNPNYYGADAFSYRLVAGAWPGDGTTPFSPDSPIVTVAMTVVPVNDVPLFTKGADQGVGPLVLEDAGPQTVAGWATAISAGPANETNGACGPPDAANDATCRQVVNFIVSNDNNALFATQPAVGADGTLTYTPAADANGVATVNVQIHDSGGTDSGGEDTSAVQSFTITVTEVNDAPTGVDDPIGPIAEDSGVRVISFASLLANDVKGPSNEDGQTLTITAVDSAVGGGVAISGTDVHFTPAAEYHGPASFVYTVQDNGTTAGADDFKTSTATVSFTITEVNDPPVGVDDPVSAVAEDSGVRTISFASLLANDSTGPLDESGQTLTITAVGGAVGGNVVIAGTDVQFTPAADYHGPASFTYTLQDNGTTAGAADFRTAMATASFTITEVNDAPVGVDDLLSSVAPDSGVRVISFASLLANDSKGAANEGGQALTITAVGSAVGGSVAINGTTVEFTVAAEYSGPASFVYTLRDDGTTNGADDFQTDTATVNFTITEGEGSSFGAATFLTPFGVDVGFFTTQAVAVGDFNGDGYPDVAVNENVGGPSGSGNSVAVLLGDGFGNFGTAARFAVGVNPIAVVAADFNSDGKLDLASVNNGTGTNGGVSILLNNGLGGAESAVSFAAASNVPLAGSPTGLVNADFNSDGNPDLAVGNASSGTSAFAILLGSPSNSGSPTVAFTTTTLPTGPSSPGGVVADFDGDGAPDLAVANQNTPVVAVLKGDGTGGFGAPTPITFSQNVFRARQVDDINGDGKPDLGVATFDASGTRANLFLLLNDTTGPGAPITFAPPLEILPPTLSFAATAPADFNGDGNMDLAVGREGLHLLVLLGDGNGGFSAPAKFLVSPNMLGFVAEDLNGDGAPDVVGALGSDGSLFVLLNNRGTESATDVSLSVDPPVVNVEAGDTPIVDLTVTNLGPATATDVRLSGGGDTGWDAIAIGGDITEEACDDSGCLIGTLGPGEMATVSLTMRALGAGPHVFSVMARAAEADPDPYNNVGTATGVVTGKSLSFYVTNTDNDGLGSLREAIGDSNANTGAPAPNQLVFNITPTAASYSIPLEFSLQTITAPAVLDATTQRTFDGVPCPAPPAACAPIVELNGAATTGGSGLTITAGNTTVRGLVINRFKSQGISMSGGGGNVIAGNYIGTDLTGTIASPNTLSGVGVSAPNTTVGGTTAADRNVISGNGFVVGGSTVSPGVFVGVSSSGTTVTSSGQNSIVAGNYIGTNVAGTAAISNGNGVTVQAPGVVVSGNLVSGNGGNGVTASPFVFGGGLTPTVLSVGSGLWIKGNLIGTNAAGTGAIPNGFNFTTGTGFAGVVIQAPNVRIGGTGAEDRNVISGNQNGGVSLSFRTMGTPSQLASAATGTLVEGNYIGVDVSGNVKLANGGTGIGTGVFMNTSNNTIGGIAPGARNIIAGNNNTGVSISHDTTTLGGSVPTNGNIVLGNYIGVNLAGAAMGNTNGVSIGGGASGNVIGGAAPGAGNVISGNTQSGISLSASAGQTATGNEIRGNYVGVDASGSAARPNGTGFAGINISVSGSPLGVVTGTIVDGNVISGNASTGLAASAGFGSLTITGNVIGTDKTGMAAIPNVSGISLSNVSNSLIGGATAAARNIISGNTGTGLFLQGSGTGAVSNNNVIQGNYIGVNAAGTAGLQNGVSGISLTRSSNGLVTNTTIGGLAAGAGNVVSGNNGTGISTSNGVTDTIIRGNLIGTNAAGTAAIGNAQQGVSINASGGTLNTLVDGNVISGNGSDGLLATLGYAGITVTGNFIGTNKAGTIAIPNGTPGNLGNGITLLNSSSSLVGGTTIATRNVISGNSGDGIYVVNNNGAGVSSGNTIQGNYIGVNETGDTAIGNRNGVELSGVSGTVASTVIGGTAVGAGNLILGSTFNGVVVLSGSTTTTIQGNHIGTNATGAPGLGNALGIQLTGTSGNAIGGAVAGAGNVVSGNTNTGILIQNAGTTRTWNDANANFIVDCDLTNAAANGECGAGNAASPLVLSTNNLVQGNIIGLTPDQSAPVDINTVTPGVQLQPTGISVSSSLSNTIGPANVVARNVVGIHIDGQLSAANVVQGNFIGTDSLGAAGLGNTGNAVLLNNAFGNTIGGTTAAARNIIGGNGLAGVRLTGVSFANTVSGNYIGTKADGTTPLGNSDAGVSVATNTGQFNTVGGTAAGAGNTIANNASAGVNMLAGTRIAIRGNSIHSNGALGIDLGGGGVTLNDGGDGDTGPNNFQNFPVLTVAGAGASTTLVAGTLGSAAGTTYALDFFASAACDSSGFGEGQRYLGSTNATTDASGNASFTATLAAGSPLGEFITATATDPLGNTSEFSSCLAATSNGLLKGQVTSGGVPLSNVSVLVYNAAGTMVTATSTNTSGDYQVALAPASYFLRTSNAQQRLDQLHNGRPCWAGCVVTTGDAVVIDGAAATTIDFALAVGGRISGTVTNTVTSAAVAGTLVEIYDAGGVLVATATTDVTGAYSTAQGLIAGSYFARTNVPAGYVNEVWNNKPSASTPVTSGDTIAVSLGVTTPGIGFALNPAATTSTVAYVVGQIDDPAPGNSGIQVITAIDVATNAVLARIPAGLSCNCINPDSIVVKPGGAQVYVSNELDHTVSVIDTASNTVFGTIGTPGVIGTFSYPNAVAVSPDGGRLYVVNGTGTVSVINTATYALMATVPLGITSARGMAISPDGTRLYVSTYGFSSVKVIDTDAGNPTPAPSVIATVGVPGLEIGVDVTPDGSAVYVASWGNPTSTISVISTGTNTVVGAIPAGAGVMSARITPDGSRAYVASNPISVVSTTAPYPVVGTVTAGSGSRTLEFTPDGLRAYSAAGSSVEVIDTTTNAVIAIIPFNIGTDGSPMAVAIKP